MENARSWWHTLTLVSISSLLSTKDWLVKKKNGCLEEKYPDNYRLITCLSLMWKNLTAQIREEIYYSLVNCGQFPAKQKGCHKGTRRTRDLLHIDQVQCSGMISSRKAKQDKILLWHGLTTKRPTIWLHEAGLLTVSICIRYLTKLLSSSRKLWKTGSGIDSMRNSFSWGENPEMYLPGRCIITITVCNGNYAS